ncbi:MAG: LamG domain-containing protein [Deltaproteobacteria bacterium]|nr:LamG domain-containing protein [Nannocystaceae bacterium]
MACGSDPATTSTTAPGSDDSTSAGTGSVTESVGDPSTDSSTDPTTASSGPGESSSSSAADQSTGDAAFNAHALHFDGVDGELVVGPVADILGPSFDAVTISVWVRRDDATAMTHGIVTLGNGSFTDTVFLFWSGEDDVPSLALYAGNGSVRAPIDPTLWHHVVATYDAAAPAPQVNLYVDGALAGSADATLTHESAGDMFIGRFGETGLWLPGDLDELALWETALGADEVAALHGDGVPTDLAIDGDGYASAASLIAWWRMGDREGGVGDMIADEAGDATAMRVGGTEFVDDVP